MKVILLKDVPKVGKKYDIKNIADGFVMNFLMPKKLVAIVTKETEAKYALLRKNQEAEEKIQEELLLKSLASLKDVHLKMIAPANEEGHLFAGIHEDAIVSLLEKETDLKLESRHLKIDKPIKSTGEHIIPVEINGKRGQFTLTITAE